ncbi:hypothetical protein Tco_1160510 [Tanacetum coccineum]
MLPPLPLPLHLLGLPIGVKISKCLNWNPLIEKLQKRLSKWKSKSLSFGARKHKEKLLLGGSLDSQKISWIAWKKVISPLKCEVLGIGSFSSSNISLLCKWWWRFYNESVSLWGSVIRSIQGPQGGLLDTSSIRSKSGPWYNIAKLRDDLQLHGIDLPSLFKIKIGNGEIAKF